MTTRWARVGRGWAAAATAISIAAASHLLAGGATPTLFALAVGLVVAGMICTMLAGKTVSLLRLSIGVGASQFLFHAVFGGLGAPVAPAHEHGASAVLALAVHDHGTMWAAHAVAAMLTVLALRFGESAFWGLRTTARILLRRLLIDTEPVRAAPPSTILATPRSYRPVAVAVVISHLRHRGPPALLVVP